MTVATELHKRLPERVRTHYLRDATLEQGLYVAYWAVPAFILAVLGFVPVGLLLIVVGLWRATPTNWGTRYFLAAEKRSDKRIRRNNYVVYDSAQPASSKVNRQVPFRVYDFGSLGTTYNPRRGTDALYFRIRGRRGAFGTYADRNAFENATANVVKGIISQTGRNIDYSFLNGGRPVDHRVVQQMLFREEQPYLSSQVQNPATVRDRWLRAQVEDLVGFEINNDADPLYFVIVTVPRPSSWRKYNMSKTGARPELIPGSLHDRVVKAMIPGLQSVGYQGVSVLSGPELHRFVFRMWNITYTYAMVDDPTRAYSLDKLEWPTDGMWAYEDYIQMKDKREDNATGEYENSFHAVLIITAFRSNLIEPGGLWPLLGASIEWSCTAMCSNTVSPTVESFLLVKAGQIQIARAKTKFGASGAQTMKDLDRIQAPIDEHNQLYLSRSRAVRFSIPIIVSATSLDELNDQVEAMMGILRELNIVAQRVEGSPTRLLRIFFAASLGIRA